MAKEDHFDKSARIVFFDVVASTAMHSPSIEEIKGSMCLGPNYSNPAGKTIEGVGLGAQRIAALCNRLTVSLNQLKSKKPFPCDKLGPKVTVSKVVNLFDPLW